MQYLRDNAGVLEASNNNTDWEPVVLGEGGGVTDHTQLTNIGTNTHAQLDAHLADGDLHAGTTDHTALTNIGSLTHQQLDSHVADTTKHFTQAEIDHQNVLSRGTNTHAQIDSHIASAALHADTTDHLLLQNIGVNTHVQLDAHLANTTIHGGSGGGGLTVVSLTADRTLTADDMDNVILVHDSPSAGRYLTMPDYAAIAQGSILRLYAANSGMLSLGDGAQMGIIDDTLGSGFETIYSTTPNSFLEIMRISGGWITLNKKGSWAVIWPE